MKGADVTEHDDDRLTRLLRATRAEADPYVWTRARARIEARERIPQPFAWLMRPAALAVSTGLLVVAIGVSWALVPVTAVRGENEADTVIEALLADANGASDDDGSAWPDSGSWQ
jgi:hypothetical protein